MFYLQERHDQYASPCFPSPQALEVVYIGNGPMTKEDGLRMKLEPQFFWSTATRPDRARQTWAHMDTVT